MDNNRFLAVVSILEGRGFPRRPKYKLIAEAKFDGELLATDPVAHNEVPDFNQELAWEMDRKALQQHRLQRSSIKILVYAYDAETTKKESVGYIVMDLRSAAQNKQVPKWHNVLHSKYHKSKPELKLSLYLDDDPNSQGASSVPKEVMNPQLPHDLKALVPVLNEEDGYYQIGPAKLCSEQFLLSVTIAYASNLSQLIPSSTSLPSSMNGFFFYYSLLGNDVTNEPFFDLVNPNFPAERASVKIRSSVGALQKFLSHQPGLQIHLCCGDQSLGHCEISLCDLLKADSTEIYMRPVTLEGTFQIFPVDKPKVKSAGPVANDSPCVGISVVIRKEDMAVQSPSREKNGPPALVTGPASHQENVSSSPKQKGGKTTTAPANDVRNGASEGNYSDDTFEEDSKDEHVHNKGQVDKNKPQMVLTQVQKNVTGITNADQHSVVPNQAHHFTFSIDLRSIKDNHSTNIINIYLRYTYPFFGSAAPIMTHPPVEIRKGSEVLLPQSFCAFDFGCTTQQLQETFVRVPLVVEVWHRDKQLSKDILIGTAKLPLSQLTSSSKTRIMSSSGVTGWRQEASDRVAVVSADGKSDHCAEISLVISLEDWGSIESQVSSATSSSSHMPLEPVLSMPNETKRVGANVIAPAVNSPRGTAEYQAAMELEMWKEEQEKEFEKKMKQKEATYMKALADEWKRRDTEREVLTQKKLTEYKNLEDQLRKTLADLEKREKKLAINEHEVMKLRSDLQREHDRKLQEMKEASRRMKEDCDHQVELQKMKLKEIEDITNRYKQELAESERKYRALEKDFALFKEQQTNTPEVRLQSQINLLTLEKIELERKLDAAAKSKIHYKQQWGKALKEVARLKQREQEVATAQLQKQQQELEQMRLRYLAAEEKEVVSKESKEFEEIKNQINKLKQMEEERLRNTSDNKRTPIIKDANGKPLNMDLDASVDEHISRLVEERDTLLRTGVYTTQDKIIAELDRQIREAIGNRSS